MCILFLRSGTTIISNVETGSEGLNLDLDVQANVEIEAFCED